MTGQSELLIEIRGNVLWLTVNRPASRNALSRATLAALGSALAAHADHPLLKAAVVTGSGTQAFAAGGDLKELGVVRTEEEAGSFFDESCDALDQLRGFPVPTVAALNGTALGGGAELAMACDFRVASPDATIGYIQARLAISCGFGGGADLVRLLGPGAALAHGLRAEALGAAEALSMGLVDRVVSQGMTLEEGVHQFLGAMLRHPVQVIRAYKAFATAHRTGQPPSVRRALERECFVQTWVHADHWQAVEAVTRKMQEKAR